MKMCSPDSCRFLLTAIIVAEPYLGRPQEEVGQEQQHQLLAEIDEGGGGIWILSPHFHFHDDRKLSSITFQALNGIRLLSLSLTAQGG